MPQSRKELERLISDIALQSLRHAERLLSSTSTPDAVKLELCKFIVKLAQSTPPASSRVALAHKI